MVTQRVLDPLSKEEKKVLRHCESVIKRGVRTFVEVGSALKEIQGNQLYREKHSTFDEYCKNRWEMSRAHAYRLIESAKVVEDVSPTGDAPERESQARPLTKLRSAQARQDAWNDAKASSPTGKPTAKLVEAAVARQEASETSEEDGEGSEGGVVAAKFRPCPDPDGIAMWYWEPVVQVDRLPKLKEDQLKAPLYTHPPKNSRDPEDSTVIVCPNLDLFSPKVPDSAVEAVLEAAEGSPSWTFLLLSECYDRLFSYAYPNNIWAGARVSCTEDLVRAEVAVASGRAQTAFLYCSPLAEELTLTVPPPFMWVVIGGSDPQPDWDAVWSVTKQADDINIPVLWAESLEARPEERPE